MYIYISYVGIGSGFQYIYIYIFYIHVDVCICKEDLLLFSAQVSSLHLFTLPTVMSTWAPGGGSLQALACIPMLPGESSSADLRNVSEA